MADPEGRDLLDAATQAALASLRVRPGTLREGLLAGLHRSAARGASVEFAEHREYAPGDDPRSVDWKVLGRTDKTYVKQYEDETNLVGTLLVDASESMAYGSAAWGTKWRFAQRLTAALAWLLIARQDSVGLWTFDGAVRGGLRPGAGPRQLDAALRHLAGTVPGGKTGFSAALTDLAARVTGRGVVVVVGDLFDDPDAILAGVGRLTLRRQSVHVVQVVDRAEATFPFDRPTRFLGLEAEPDLTADPRALRGAYLSAWAAHRAALARGLAARAVPFHVATTDEPLVPLVRRIVLGRPRRVDAGEDAAGAAPATRARGGGPSGGRRFWRWLVGS